MAVGRTTIRRCETDILSASRTSHPIPSRDKSMFKPGIRYNVVSTLDDSSPGYLIDSVYYENGNALGGLEGDLFIYRMDIDFAGTPRYPDHIAGKLEGFEIVRTGDNVRFRLVEATTEHA